MIGDDESDTAEQVIGSLAKLRGRDAIYSRGGQLVHVVAQDESRVAGMEVSGERIRPFPKPLIRERVTQCCQLKKQKQKGGTYIAKPEAWLVDSIYHRGSWDYIRPLTGITDCPRMRNDGSILQQIGYDESTGLLFSPTITFQEIGNHPTREDAIESANRLLTVVADFPFETISDRLGWLCLVLTYLCRPAIHGPCPMFAVSANVAGSGKSMLIDIASLIATGKVSARKPYLNDGELGKSITAIAIEAIPSVMLDNVDGSLGGANLDMVLTSMVWTDRVLGISATTGELPIRTVWSCTGNNVRFAGDTRRRVLPIRIDSRLEKPEERKGFKIDPLLPWVLENRASLVRDALTIARAFVIAGRIDQGLRWGSFEAWTALIPSAIAWLGLGSPIETRATLDATDDSLELARAFILGIEESTQRRGKPVTASEIIDDAVGWLGEIRQAVLLVDDQLKSPVKVGLTLKKLNRRVVDGKMIVAQKDRKSISRYSVELA